MLHWWKYKRNLSPYRDHALPAADYRSVWSHLYHCQDCREEVDVYERFGESLREMPSARVPAELVSRIRQRVSAERARRERPGWLWTVKNQWGHLALPGAAGIFSAVLLFVMFASHFASPLRAVAGDVPLVVRTSARLRDSRALELNSNMGDFVVQILVDRQGRVADYDIVAGTYTAEDARTLRNNLLFAVFDPATIFGTPTSDTLILSYRKVHVRG